MPHTAYIVDCVRVASGRKNGALAKWHPADLGAVVVDELVTRAKVPPAAVDDVIFGCVSQVGAQAGNIGRMVVLSSKVLPETVPGTVVDRQCGSSLQAIHFAAQAVMSGTQDVVIAGGVEVMSLVPIGASVFDGANAGHGLPNSAGIKAKYPANDGLFSQFEGAEIVANDFSLSRADLEALAVRSHKLAAQAQAEKRFDREIVAVAGVDKAGREIVHRLDEGVRPTTTLEALAKLPTLKAGGKITPGTSSPITDGAAAVLICNERALRKYNLRPRAKIIGLGLSGTDPVSMLKGPIPATSNALKAAGLSMSDIDLFEVNEAFASVPLAWAKALKADINKLNVNGGAMALGHPLGATGAKLTTTLVNELERSKKRYGLIAICEGGGTANATVFERVDASAASKL